MSYEWNTLRARRAHLMRFTIAWLTALLLCSPPTLWLLTESNLLRSSWTIFRSGQDLNLTFGLITPPIGQLLYVMSAVVKIRVSEMTPFMTAYLVILALITFIGALSTWLPIMTGF